MPTPLHIKMALHYATCAGPFSADDRRHANSPAVEEAHNAFVSLGLLEKLDKPNEYGVSYEATQGLMMWKEAICAVNAPTKEWTFSPPHQQGHRT